LQGSARAPRRFLPISGFFLPFRLCAALAAALHSASGNESQEEPSVNKADLIQKIADRTGLDKNDATKAVDGVFETITEALKAGDEVRLTGFGVFAVANRAAGKGRNPQTGAEIEIKASRQPKFRAGKQLKDSLNESA
jgi:DNA-binding protein HU-beta